MQGKTHPPDLDWSVSGPQGARRSKATREGPVSAWREPPGPSPETGGKTHE